MVESDCAELVALLSSSTRDQSSNMYQLADVADLLKERETHVQRIGRAQNKASHAMAAIGRGQQCTACWLSNVPQEISTIISEECKTIIN